MTFLLSFVVEFSPICVKQFVWFFVFPVFNPMLSTYFCRFDARSWVDNSSFDFWWLDALDEITALLNALLRTSKSVRTIARTRLNGNRPSVSRIFGRFPKLAAFRRFKIKFLSVCFIFHQAAQCWHWPWISSDWDPCYWINLWTCPLWWYENFHVCRTETQK